MPEQAIHLRSTPTLEHKLQRELNEPRIPQLATRNSETRIVGTTTSRIRWAKLDAIKRIEELRPELQTELFPRPEARRLEYREVPVIDPFAPKVRIHARLVPETKVGGSGEASRVKPGDAPCLRYMRGTLGASPHNIGAQGPDSQTRLGQRRGASIAYRQWETLLKCRDAIEAPSGNRLARDAADIGQVLLTMPKGQVINVAHYQALGHVLGRERPLCLEVVPVLHFSNAALQPGGQGIRVGHEF